MATESNMCGSQPTPVDFSPSPSLAENYWTRPRRELRAWFQRNAPSLGELYEGALRMIFGSEFPGRTRFVAHAVREIRNRLPDAITGPRKGGTAQYINRLDDIAKHWRKAGFSLDGTIHASITEVEAVPSTDIPVPHQLFQKLTILVKEHVEAREKPEEAAIRLFEGIAPENQNLRNSLRPIVHQWLNVTEWFVQKAHDSRARDSDFDAIEFRKRFELFETTLGALVGGFFKTVEGLDEILEDANS